MDELVKTNEPIWNVPKDKAIYVFEKPMRIKFSDIFDMKEFYDILHEWLMEKDWQAYDGDREQWETYYGQRHDRSGAREVWALWKLRKMPSSLNKPMAYFLNIYWHIIKLVDTEAIREGHKWKLNKGGMEIKVYPVIELTFMKALEELPVIRNFSELFAKRIYDTAIKKRKKSLYQEVMNMFNFMKQWFKMKRYLPYEETKLFFPTRAWASHQQEK